MSKGRKLYVREVLVCAGAVVVLALGFFGWRVSQALRLSREEVRAAQEIRIDARPYAPDVETGFEQVSSPAVFLQAARFQDHLYLGGPGGLLEYDLSGAPTREFVPGRDLPLRR